MKFSVFGPYRGVTGYDFMVRNFLKEWYKQGHTIQLHEFTKWSNLRAPTEMDEQIKEMEANQVPDPDFHLNFCLLDQAQLNPNTLNYIYTMFESDKICKLWVDCARRVDGIIVPTEFNRKSFIESGIPDSKLRVCPIPLDILHILNGGKNVQVVPFGEKENILKYKCRYLHVSEFIGRKNVEGLLQAWCMATKETDDACLILKLNSNSGVKLDFLKTRFDSFVKTKKCAPVFLLVEYLTDSQMMGLYNVCTHYITASFGEGWGLSESICGVLGKKIIAPESTAFTDYLNKENSYTVGVTPIGAQQDGGTAMYYQGSNWFAPIQFMLRKAIQKSMEDELKNDNTKNALLQKSIIEKCESFTVANGLANILHKFNPRSATHSKLDLNEQKNNFTWMMICKSLNTQCGIADYTDMLTKSMIKKQGKSFSDWLIVNGDAVHYQNCIDVCRGQLHIANIQLEYQFISPKRLEYFIKFCDNSGIVPIVTMHTVNPRAYDYHEVLKKTLCNIIVSSEKMKSTLINESGFDGNLIKVIPMGISTNNVISSTTQNPKFKIGFFGFCYFHKGIDKLIQYMNKFGGDKECFLYSSKPTNDSGYWEKITKLFQQNAINSYWLTDYKDEAKIVEELSKCDLIVLPYSEYGGIGVSAAIRTCLKSGVPIASFENSFFQDVVLDSGLVKFIGNDPENFFEWSQNLNNFIDAMKKLGVSHVKENYMISRNKFLEEYNWDKIADKYLEHYKELLVENTKK